MTHPAPMRVTASLATPQSTEPVSAGLRDISLRLDHTLRTRLATSNRLKSTEPIGAAAPNDAQHKRP